ncbi:hypothetical protein BDN72DRAFT_246742 [Pluteus cervinus]|uniref:Uncharacterized protein n=1 Tax=Pluteus cervinus TaxID=181527 RepID=A0ACD3B5L9_9AGAR|nr:hypothetical protein BDN72DRAFT_246742 [Pluteus cervinus]
MDAFKPHILRSILHAVSGPDLIRFASVNLWARNLVSGYMEMHFSIDELLGQFFLPHHTAELRRLQADIGVIISGSQAVQFFDRRRFDGSDLDLYAHISVSATLEDWLSTAGYIRAMVVQRTEDSQVPEVIHHSYDGPVTRVATFRRLLGGNHTVQVISTCDTAIEVILAFPLTCVMNIITHNEAISFYPIATFHRREALVNKKSFSRNLEAFFGKYQDRGWTIMETLDGSQQFDQLSDFYCPPDTTRTRHVGDKHCWSIPLPPIEGCVDGFDYKFVNSWHLTYRNGPSISFTILRHKKLTHSYVVAMDMGVVRKVDDLLQQTSWDKSLLLCLRDHFART